MNAVIEARGLTRIYRMGDNPVPALRGVDLTIEEGEFVAIMGASGSGKSTLMNILGCLDYPTTGDYRLNGMRVNELSRDRLADLRAQRLGFVFQTFNLLPRTSALANVELPLLYDRSGRFQDSRGAAFEALERVGLAERLDHEPNQLSGGQQQRVAIARALVNRPSLLLADEPTGNLDSRTSLEVIHLFQELNDQGITVVLVTHEDDIAAHARRIVVMRDGLIVSDGPVEQRRVAPAVDGTAVSDPPERDAASGPTHDGPTLDDLPRNGRGCSGRDLESVDAAAEAAPFGAALDAAAACTSVQSGLGSVDTSAESDLRPEPVPEGSAS